MFENGVIRHSVRLDEGTRRQRQRAGELGTFKRPLEVTQALLTFQEKATNATLIHIRRVRVTKSHVHTNAAKYIFLETV